MLRSEICQNQNLSRPPARSPLPEVRLFNLRFTGRGSGVDQI